MDVGEGLAPGVKRRRRGLLADVAYTPSPVVMSLFLRLRITRLREALNPGSSASENKPSRQLGE